MQIKFRLVLLFVVLLAGAALLASGLFRDLYLSLLMLTQDWQRLFHDEVASKLRLIQETHSLEATGSLVLIGFLYGAIHAVGPGHGKVVVSSYLLASKSSLKRGLVITFLSSLMQACVAVLIVVGLTALLGLTHEASQQTAQSFETISFGLILLIGAALLLRGGKEFWRLYHHGQAPHAHHADEPCPCCCCGGHAPDPQKVEKAEGPLALLGLIVSIGMRPCSGALLILIFADLVGALSAGIAACFAMSFGTALTTGLLAVLTVQSKALALRLTRTSGSHLRVAQAGLSVAGGLLIILLGTAFLQGNAMASGLGAANDGFSAAQQHPLMKGFRF